MLLCILGFILLLFPQPRLFAVDVVGTLVNTVETSCYTNPNCPAPNTTNPGAIGSPDPSGLTYLSAGPSAGRLLMSDGEVEEMPWLWDNQGVNAFEMTLAGDLTNSSDISTLSVTTTVSDEPNGMAFNPNNSHVFISDDLLRQIFEIDLGADGLLGTADDTIVATISTNTFGSGDPEGLAYDPIEGAIYIADGVDSEIYKLLPGPNGQFDGVPADGGDDIVTSFDTLSLGVSDPEGIAWDPATGNLYIVGVPATRVAEVTTAGALVRMIDISSANAIKPAGLALGPWSGVNSDPNPGVLNLYIVDRGVDNSAGPDYDPFENDGKLYEFSIPEGSPVSASAGPDQTIVFSASCGGSSMAPCATLIGTVTPSQAAITWSVVSGPGQVIFENQNSAETTASFGTDGLYVLRITADDSGLSSSDDVQITVLPPIPLTNVFVSTDTNSGTVGGVSFGREDILRYDVATDAWFVHFDGSNVGLDEDINGFHILADGSILFTMRGTAVLPDVGFVDTMDIVRFIPTTLGENNTAGFFELYFKGSNVGLGPSSQVSVEGINALGFLSDGRLVVSTSGSFSVSGVSGKDEDLIAFTATSLGEATSGTWEFYFDGTDVALGDGGNDEELEGVFIDNNGDIFLTTKGDFSVPGLSGDSADIIRCIPLSTGSTTACTYDLVWSGSSHGLLGHRVNGIQLVSGVANSVPAVAISAPADNSSFTSGTSIEFTGTASDAEDGDLTGSLAWSSSLDGPLVGNGGTITNSSLSVGTHVIKAAATDSGGFTGEDFISVTISVGGGGPTNTTPAVTIGAPADNSSFILGESIAFTGTASDTEDGDLTGSLVWSSSLDGALGNGGTVNSSSLSVGTHVITAMVTDSGGLDGSNTISVTISSAPLNTTPTVMIGAPADNSSFTPGELIVFTGTASDTEDGDLTGSLVWSSSRDGALGNGSTVNSSSLSVGTHVITATVTDSGGLDGSNTISITISSTSSSLPTGIFVSTDTNSGTVGGVSFGREDILRYDVATDAWFVHFDGSDVGVDGEDINGFHIMADGSILFTMRGTAVLPDVGSVDTMDIVRFVPTTLGENNTAGVFELYFKGSDVGLGPSSQVSAERINALSVLSDGRLIVSTSGSFAVPGVSGKDEDLIAFTATSLGEVTSGTWEIYFDGSDVALRDGGNGEELEGVSISDNGDIFLTTKGAFSVPGLSGDGADILRCTPQSTGSTTTCTYDLFWSGSEHGLAGHSLNGVQVVQ